MAETKHVHKLRRRRYQNGTAVFFCVGDDCTFKIGTEFSLGKKTICWRCGEPFNLTPYSLTLAKPHCEACHKHKSSETIQEIRTEPLRLEKIDETLEELRERAEKLVRVDEIEL